METGLINRNQFFEAGKNRDELIVFLHGVGNASQRLADIRTITRAAKPDADFFAPKLPYAGNRLCMVKAENIVAELMQELDSLNSTHEYTRILLVGHSFGAVLARKLALVAHGEQSAKDGDLPAPFEPELDAYRQARPWANKIERLVLMAGMNRGWTTSSAMDWITTLNWSVAQAIGELVLSGKPTIFALRRGAPFLVNTRLQWLAMMDPNYGCRPDLIVTQLLGTNDDNVSPDDNVDFSVDIPYDNEKQAYHYLEVPMSGHTNVVEMVDQNNSESNNARQKRREVYLAALWSDREQLAKQCVKRDQMADSLPPAPDMGVTDLVFVIHGIRDKGFWTQKIARNIKRHAGPGQKFESWTESYGYFAMLPFALRSVRQRKVEWLMDRYVEAKARFPRARFHYVGHSNGTYLCAQALQDYLAARFDRIVFAGSVVRKDYNWMKLIEPQRGSPRVRKVLNYVATRDWVVAMLPNSVQRWRWFNLGSAGHDGFLQAKTNGPVYQARYIVGGHSVGHEEANWDNIAGFIVAGAIPQIEGPLFSDAPSRFWHTLGALSTPAIMLALGLVLGFGGWLASRMFLQCDLQFACHTASAPQAVAYFALFTGYLALLRVIVTRF
jgi:pimeloyl-ACP methyl ester carboxylesterase